MSCEASRPSTPPLLRPQRVGDSLTDSFDVQFWTNIRSLDIDSREYILGVQSLLNSPSKITLARSLKGAKAQMFTNFLDQVS